MILYAILKYFYISTNMQFGSTWTCLCIPSQFFFSECSFAQDLLIALRIWSSSTEMQLPTCSCDRKASRMNVIGTLQYFQIIEDPTASLATSLNHDNICIQLISNWTRELLANFYVSLKQINNGIRNRQMLVANAKCNNYMNSFTLKTEFWSKLVEIGQNWSRIDIGHSGSSD